MGMVFQAYDKNLQRPVAIKFIKDMVADETSRMRFQQEVEFLNRGEGHPNIVQVYDYGNVTVGEQVVPYLVMRYMPGSTLADRLFSLAIAHPDIRDQVLRDICEGLTFLHNNGIVHRDLKPANILFDSTPNQQWGRAHISDFGVSWLVSNTSGRIGSGGTGTDWYRAPEQKPGGSQPIDHRADIYAFGLIVWQLFTNRPLPFDLESLPPDTLSKPLQDALHKALASDPADRWSSVTEFFNEVMQSPHPLETPPYQGLDVITNQHTFFGRSSLVNDLVAFLDTHQDLALVGVSGSGKSSLVRAGLMPELWGREIFSSTDTYLLTPKSQPLQSLADALTRSSELSKALAIDFSVDPNGFHAWVLQNHEKEILIVVDQLEELFTECKSENERMAFINNLFYAVDHKDSRVRIVFTLRADFFSHCLKIDRLKTLLTTSQRLVGAMSPEDLRAAIEGPANIKGWSLTFDEGLVDMMVKESSKDAGHLPLLSFALLQTWHRRKGRRLTLPDYEAIGRVEGAIARTADGVLARLDGEQREIARHILVRLVNLGEGTDDTRRRVDRSELLSLRLATETVEEVLLALSKERLIIAEQKTFVLAHDAIIREWDQLKQWLAENREWKVTHRYLTNIANAWKILDKDPGELFRGGRLTHTREQATIYHTDLNETEREFLAASESALAAEEAERKAVQEREAAQLRKIAEEESRRRRITARALIGVSVLLIIAILVAIYAINQQQLAENTTVKLAEEVDVRRAAEGLAETNAQLAATRAFEAISEGERADEARATAVFNSQLAATRAVEAEEQAVLAAAESDRANYQARQSRSGELAAYAQASLSLYPQRSLLLAVEALHTTISSDGSYTRSAEEAIRQALSATSGSPIDIQESAITVMATSEDNKWLATGNKDGEVRLWDLTRQEPLQPIVYIHEGEIAELAISPDSHWLIVGTMTRSAYIWDLTDPYASRKLLFAHECPGYQQGVGLCPIDAFDFSEDGLWFAIYENGGGTWNATENDWSSDPLLLFDLTKGWETSPLNLTESIDFQSNITSLAISPDGRWLAAGATGYTNEIFLWDLSTQNSGPILSSDNDVFQDRIALVAISPDSHWIFAGSNTGEARIWDLTSPNPMLDSFELTGHEGAVITGAEFSKDNRWLVTAGFDDTARVWDLASIDPSASPITLIGHDDNINEIAITHDSKWLATGSEDHNVFLWDLTRLEQYRIPVMLHGHDLPITALVTTSDSRKLITGSADGMLRMWDIEAPNNFTGQSVLTIDGSPVRITAISSNNWTAAGTRLGAIDLWNSGLTSSVIHLTEHTGAINDLEFSPNNRWLISTSNDNSAHLWDLNSKNIAAPFTTFHHEQDVNGAVFTADSNSVITISNDHAYIWDLTASNPAQNPIVLSGHDPSGNVETVEISPDNRWLATGSWDRTVRLWDLVDPDPNTSSVELDGFDLGVFDVEFSPDSHWLVAAGNEPVAYLWNLSKQDPFDTNPIRLSGHNGIVSLLAFSHSGRWLATGSGVNDLPGGNDNTIRLWDMASLSLNMPSYVLQHEDMVLSMAFSPDDRWLVSGGADHNIYLWDLMNPNEAPRVIQHHTDWINSVSVSPDSNWVIAGSGDGTVSVWPLEINTLMILACEKAGRNLTYAEWKQVFPHEAYRQTCPQLPQHFTVPPPLSGKVLFADDFSNVNSGLTNYSTGTWGTRGYLDNETYGFDLMPLSGPVWDLYSSQQLPDIFMIEADCGYSGSANNGYGFVFQAVDRDRFYAFQISGDGFVTVNRFDNSNWVTTNAWEYSLAINQSPGTMNKITVLGKDNWYYFYVNGQMVLSFFDEAYKEGSFGLIVVNFDSQSSTTSRCDNLIVSMPAE